MSVKKCSVILIACTLLTLCTGNVYASINEELAEVASDLLTKQEEVDAIEAELVDTVGELQSEYQGYIENLESDNQQLQKNNEYLNQLVDEYSDTVNLLNDGNVELMKVVPRQRTVLNVCAGIFGFLAIYFIYVFSTNYQILRTVVKGHIKYAFSHILRNSTIVDKDRCFHMLKCELHMTKTRTVLLTYDVRINLVNFFIWKKVLRGATIRIRFRSADALPFVPIIVQNLNNISRKFPDKLDIVFDCPNSIEAYKIIYGSTYCTSFINPGSKINFVVQSRQNLPARYVMNVAESVYGSEMARGNRLPGSLDRFQHELKTYSALFQQILDSTIYKGYVLQCAVEFVDLYGIPLTIKCNGIYDFTVPEFINIVTDGQVICMNYNSMKLYEDLKKNRSILARTGC